MLEELAEEDSRVLPDPTPVIAVGQWQESAVTLVMKVWCRQEEYWNLFYSMQEKVKEAFDKAGVEIPFPQMDVHIRPEK